jgi:hypothetical protein
MPLKRQSEKAPQKAVRGSSVAALCYESRAATELQQSCNRAATELQRMCLRYDAESVASVAVLSYESMTPQATSLWGRKLQAYPALSYESMRPEATTSVCGLNLRDYEA